MDVSNLESKYQKLASEYSKLRAQASVLKKAVLEEQTKSSNLRDNLRQKETALRRSEQEVDSLGFRNKQLEHRVASLQDDIEKECKKTNMKQQKNNSNKILNKNNSTNSLNNDINGATSIDNASSAFFEELQKKIMENAQLTSLIDDKERDINLYNERCFNLEKQLEKRNVESIELEKRLRRDMDALIIHNSELETKLVEAASMLGSEDALSASGSDNTTPLNTTGTNSSSTEDRIMTLEKELCHWRTQYEILKISNCMPFDRSKDSSNKCLNGPMQTALTGATSSDKKVESTKEQNSETKEQLMYKHFSKKVEDLLKSKCLAESRLTSYLTECETLQLNLEILMNELKNKELELKTSERNVQTLEDDLATTRINYEEQISVLTEQVISLSEQLASSK